MKNEILTVEQSYAADRYAANHGVPITLGTDQSPSDLDIVTNHVYTVINVLDQNHIVVRNPWGDNQGSGNGNLLLSMSDILANFELVTVPNSSIQN